MTRKEFMGLRSGDKVQIIGRSKFKGLVVFVLDAPASTRWSLCIVSGGRGVYSHYALKKVND